MISEVEWSTDSSQTLNIFSTREERRGVEEHEVSRLRKQNDSFLSPVIVRQKRRQKKTSKQTAEMGPSIDKDHRQIENHFELKEDNETRLCGVGEEKETATQKGQRKAEQQARLHRNNLSSNQKPKTIHETSGQQCKLPPLRSTCNNGTTYKTSIRDTEHTSLSSGKLEDELQKQTRSISTAGTYDLNDLRKNLKLKKENPEGILKISEDGNGLHSARQSSTSEEVMEKVDKKVHFQSLSQHEDRKDTKYTIRTVTFPLQLVKLGHNAAIPAKPDKTTVVFPNIVDHKACRRREPYTGNGKASHSLAYFRLDHRRLFERRTKRHRQNDREPSVECRGEACFPGFLSLPSLKKVTDWLAQ